MKKEKRRRAGLGNAILTRFADDFVILWNGTHRDALKLRDELKQYLWDELRLELSEEKTRVTHVMDGLNFLGFHIQYRTKNGRRPMLIVTPTKENIERFTAKIKALTRRNTVLSPVDLRFQQINRVIRGWGNYYSHVSFSRDANQLDWWIPKRMLIWLTAKHKKGARWALRRYLVQETNGGRNRKNFATKTDKGTLVYLARLTDIKLTQYRRQKPKHPYLETELVPMMMEPEDPFPDVGPDNIGVERTEWLETRSQVKERDGYRCTRCGKPVEVIQIDAHHEQAPRDGGSNDLDNLVTLCRDCHKETPNFGRKKTHIG